MQREGGTKHSSTGLFFKLILQAFKVNRLKTIAQRLTYADVCWSMLTYADVCWRMQFEDNRRAADVCWRRLADAGSRQQNSSWNVSDTEQRKVLEVRTKKLLQLEQQLLQESRQERSCSRSSCSPLAARRKEPHIFHLVFSSVFFVNQKLISPSMQCVRQRFSLSVCD